MLEKNDLKLIKDVFDQSLEEKLENKLDPIKQDLRFIKSEIGELKQKIDEIKTMEVV